MNHIFSRESLSHYMTVWTLINFSFILFISDRNDSRCLHLYRSFTLLTSVKLCWSEATDLNTAAWHHRPKTGLNAKWGCGRSDMSKPMIAPALNSPGDWKKWNTVVWWKCDFLGNTRPAGGRWSFYWIFFSTIKTLSLIGSTMYSNVPALHFLSSLNCLSKNRQVTTTSIVPNEPKYKRHSFCSGLQDCAILKQQIFGWLWL